MAKPKAYYEALLANPNIQRGLATIRKAEGATYNTLFGGKTFSNFSWHPLPQKAILLPNGKTTSAAGAYQFERGTWDNVARELGLTDFSPKNQDIAALELLDENHSLGDVISGNVASFVSKNKGTWESFKVRAFSQIVAFWNGASSDGSKYDGITMGGSVAQNSYTPISFSLSSDQQKIAKESLPAQWRGMIVLILALVVFVVVWGNYR